MQSIPFNPNFFLQVNMSHFGKDCPPRYLFRVHAPLSAGESSAYAVRSPAALYDLDEQLNDLFAMAPFEAADSLLYHLEWKCDDSCNLMSWTTSLLFALQYGLHRHRTDKDNPEFDDIFLLMIDTRDFPERTFIKDLEAVNALNTLEMRQMRHWDKYLTRRNTGYFGEYLSQGALRIHGRCVEVSFQTLINLGLFELFPPLAVEAEWEKWARRVTDLRQPFYKGEISSSTANEVRTAVRIARDSFGGRWTFPVAAMLLAFRPRAVNDLVILEGFKEEFSKDEIQELSLHDIQIDCHVLPDDRAGLPELVQFKKLVNDVHRHFIGMDINSEFWTVR
ncbi:hypothetical protein ALT_4781 [Aspergillus lentulus]|uniref:DUF7587 domain-containing protein n=1 Tax=Aspergillus lentulus TaxID=293939 RepID=A0AAN4TAK0_ASPLE|nr:hypothetical protein ALT_4781 [Aspergillus lentulus]